MKSDVGLVDLSIVIPTTGRHSLLEAIDSISEPDLRVEVIVVTDIIDNLAQVKLSLGGRKVVLIKGPNLGSSSARNYGISISKGRYIAFLDDDDIWMPGKATKQINAIEAFSAQSRALSVTGVTFRSRKGRTRRSSRKLYRPTSESLATYIVSRRQARFRGIPFCSSTMLVSRGLIAETRFDETLSLHVDWDFILRLNKKPNMQIVQLAESLAEIRQGSVGSISANKNWRNSMNFLQRFSSEISGRARVDFVLVAILLPAVNSRSVEGMFKALKEIPIDLPHLGAAMRFVFGVALRK